MFPIRFGCVSFKYYLKLISQRLNFLHLSNTLANENAPRNPWITHTPEHVIQWPGGITYPMATTPSNDSASWIRHASLESLAAIVSLIINFYWGGLTPRSPTGKAATGPRTLHLWGKAATGPRTLHLWGKAATGPRTLHLWGKAATGPRTLHQWGKAATGPRILRAMATSVVADAHSIVWQTHILLFGRRTFYCVADAHSIVRQTHILLFDVGT